MIPLATGVSLPEGAYPGWFGFGDDLLTAVDSFISKTGQSPASLSIWCSWGSEGQAPRGRQFPSEVLLDGLYILGITPLIFWEPSLPVQMNSMRRIADGEFDEYLIQWARDAAAWGNTVLVRFAHEMNGNWFPWSAGKNDNTVRDYKDAWNRVYTIVRTIARNVRFIWCPNIKDAGLYDMEDYWVGDTKCQYVGLDGYKWVNDGNSSLLTQFERPISRLRAISQRQIIICEFGISDGGTADDRRAYLKGYKDLAQRWYKLKGINYFNINMRSIEGPDDEDWRLDTSPNMMYTYKMMVNDPDFQGSY